jgi:acyl-CoA synthetase (AMP-forming)/AMP-acid ligase II
MALLLMAPFDVLHRYRSHHHTLSDTLASRLEKNAHDLFCIDGDKSYTWQEFAKDVQKTTQLLQQKGITPHDRVGIMSRNQYTHVVLLFALGHLSAILVPINPEFSIQEASYVLAHAELSGLVFDQHSSQVAQIALQEKNLHPWLIALGHEAINEIPTLILIFIIILVIVKPF